VVDDVSPNLAHIRAERNGTNHADDDSYKGHLESGHAHEFDEQLVVDDGGYSLYDCEHTVQSQHEQS